MLIGVAVTFAVVATLAAVAGGWAVEANQYGRGAATLFVAFWTRALTHQNLGVGTVAFRRQGKRRPS
jgi:hypothetical protein